MMRIYSDSDLSLNQRWYFLKAGSGSDYCMVQIQIQFLYGLNSDPYVSMVRTGSGFFFNGLNPYPIFVWFKSGSGFLRIHIRVFNRSIPDPVFFFMVRSGFTFFMVRIRIRFLFMVRTQIRFFFMVRNGSGFCLVLKSDTIFVWFETRSGF